MDQKVDRNKTEFYQQLDQKLDQNMDQVVNGLKETVSAEVEQQIGIRLFYHLRRTAKINVANLRL